MRRRTQFGFLLLGIAAFVLLVDQAGPAQLLAQVRQSWPVLLPIVLIYGVVYLASSEAWRLTMHDRPPRISSPRAYAITAWAFALNYVTPMVSVGGEPFKIAAASPWLGRRGATASVLGERLLHMQGHLLFFLTGVGLAFVYLPRTAIGMVPLSLAAAGLLLLSAIALVPHRHGGAVRVLEVLKRLPLVRRKAAWLEGKRAAAAEVDAQLIAFYRESRARYVGAILLEYAGRCLSVVEIVLIARAVGVELSYGTAYLVTSFTSFAVNALFFLPFGLGSREGGLYVIFALLGLPPGLGVATSMLGRLREITWVALGLAFGTVASAPARTPPLDS